MKIMLLLIVMLLALPAQGRELADVEFADVIAAPVADKQLQLNGLGIRYKFVFKIYIAALYLEQPAHEVNAILSDRGAKRILMHFLYDEVSKGKLVDAWLEGFKNNLNADELKRFDAQIQQFNSMFETVQRNDVVQIDYLPGQGTRVMIKGQDKGLIADDGFYPALLKIWLGDDPVSDDLKQALLGNE
ncbi:MAG TPA: chalcone isomerase family protein [Gammaproteobacteria bacterium]